MDLIVVRDKNGVDLVQAVDEVHSSVKPKRKTGGGESVPVHGMFAQDGDGEQIIFTGVSGGRIQNMVVELSVLLKVPLVDAGGDDGPVGDGNHQHGGSLGIKGLLDADAKRASVRLVPDAEDVSTQVDDGGGHFVFHKEVFEPIGNVALGDGAQVDEGLIVGEGNGVSVQGQLFIAHMGEGL